MYQVSVQWVERCLHRKLGNISKEIFWSTGVFLELRLGQFFICLVTEFGHEVWINSLEQFLKFPKNSKKGLKQSTLKNRVIKNLKKIHLEFNTITLVLRNEPRRYYGVVTNAAYITTGRTDGRTDVHEIITFSDS